MADNYPHLCNACGGNYHDWLEVLLTDKCNGNCSWCVERAGWHPEHHATWEDITLAAIDTGKQNVILLGGEPTMYPNFSDVVETLDGAGRSVWTTTNGSMLTGPWVRKNMQGIHGVNISIHHWDLIANCSITGIRLNRTPLAIAIAELHQLGATVRFNCNCISGNMDCEDACRLYINFARNLGADSVRFSELKLDDGKFVPLTDCFGHDYGLNDEPYSLGCSKTAVIDGMPIHFRQMCGLQTPLRPMPEHPKQVKSPVLYYDGRLYDGWQLPHERDVTMDAKEIADVLEQVKAGVVSIEEGTLIIESGKTTTVYDPTDGKGCVY